ncbi:Retrotransposon gag domain [Sesbania bispinosa]|nr:Retrotransposon gag domain [Sesbania bispinosa]
MAQIQIFSMPGLATTTLLFSWIYNSVSKEIIASIMYSSLACEIWQDLRNRFQQKNGPRIFQLRKELMSLVQGHDSVNQYFTKLKVIWEELSAFKPLCNCTCGGLRPMEEHCQMDNWLLLSRMLKNKNKARRIVPYALIVCQQLISMLSTQLANVSPVQDSSSAQGQIMFDEDWQG